MLHRTPGLSRPVLKWVSQVTASLGATLSATLIWSAVPHPGAAPAAREAAQPELTSGGKFAARAVQPAAYDGLDTMPLPRLAPAPARFVLASIDVPPPRTARRAAWDDTAAPAAPTVERRPARPARPPARAEARRGEPSFPPVAPATAAAPMPDTSEEGGFLHRVLPSSLQGPLQASLPSLIPSLMPGLASTAREAWSVTASAGDALVAHIVPRMP